LLFLQLSFLLGSRKTLFWDKRSQNWLVPEMPALQVKAGLLYFSDGAIRELVRPKNERTLAGQRVWFEDIPMSHKISSGSGLTVFPVDDVTPAAKPIWTESLAQSLARRFMRKVAFLSEPALPVVNEPYDSVYQKFPGKNLSLVGSRCHSLIEAVQIAFSQHRPLVLSPDCVWLVIAQGFSHHIAANAEALRHSLVRHQGKQQLQEKLEDLSHEGYRLAIAGLSAQIRGASDPVLHDTLICDFSTTTPEIRTASEVVLMDTYSSYFKYEMRCVCGIPAIALTGSEADWQRMRERIEVLETYELQWWIARLRPILDEFIQTIKGHPNRQFWQAIYKPKNFYFTDSVTGWITDLFPYLGDPPERRRSHVFEWARENWLPAASIGAETPGSQFASVSKGVGTKAFPSGLSSVSFELTFPDHSTRKLDLVAGFFGIEQDPEDLALSPVIGWCVAEPPPQTPVLVSR
jgi:hypothetical protein